MSNKKQKLSILKVSTKVIISLLVLVIVLLGAAYFYISTNSGKQFVTNKVQSYLAKKLKTSFTIGSVNYHLPNEITLSKIYLPSLSNDSLLYAGELKVSIALFKLMMGETEIKNLELKNTFIHISRKENDSNYNFQFVIDAFAGNKKTDHVQKDTADLKLNLHRLLFSNVVIDFDDEYAGSFMYANVASLELKMKTFKPNKLIFDINSLNVDGLTFNGIITKHREEAADTFKSKNYLLLDAKNFNLNDVNVTLSDRVSDLQYTNHIENLILNNAKVSLASNKVEIDKIILTNSLFELAAKPASTPESLKAASVSIPWFVEVAQIEFANNSFKMNTGKPHVHGFDASNINATELSLKASDVFYTTDSTHAFISNFHVKDHSGLSIDTLHANVIYSLHQIEATELYVKTPGSLIQNTLKLSFDSLKNLTANPEKSYVNVNLQNTVIDFDEMFEWMPNLKSNTSLAKLQHDKLSINSKMNGSLQQLDIAQLNVMTLHGTALNLNAQLTNITDPKRMLFDVNVLPSQILKTDLAKFVEFDKEAFATLPNIFMLQGNAKGNLNDLATNIKLNSNQLLLNAQAKLRYVTDSKKLHYDADIKALSIQKDLIMAFIPKDKFPKNIELPNTILAAGTVIGDMNNVTANIYIDGSFGKISLNGFVKNFKEPEQAVYDISMATNQFLVGKLLKQDSILDAVTMRAIIKGKGFDVNSMVSKVQAEIDQIGFKDYNYKDINISADLFKGSLQSTGSVNDPNVRLNYQVNSNSINKPTNLTFFLHLDTARLHELKLTQDTISLAANLNLKADDLAMNSLRAKLLVDSINMTMNGKRMKLDSISVKADKENENQVFAVQSPFMTLNAKGNFEYNKIGPAMMTFMNRYYHVSDVKPETVNTQQIAFEGKIYEHPFITNFVSGLTHYDSIVFVGNFNSLERDSAFNFSLQAPYIEYNNNKLEETTIKINANADRLQFHASADSVNTAQTSFLNTQVKAILSHDSLDVDVLTKNSNGTNRYALGAMVSVNDKAYMAHLKDSIILNNQRWSIQPNNILFYSPQGFYISDFNLATNQSLLMIQSEQKLVKSPIHVEIKNFSINDITSVLNKDTMLATGFINGNFKVSDFDKILPSFEGAIKIDRLFVKQHKVGTLALTTNRIDDNTIQANVNLSENENDISLEGNYYLNNTEKQIEADIRIGKFNIATLEGFSVGNITNATGSINGKINVKGKFAEPVWNGNIHFTDPAFRLAKFGTSYKVNNQNIALKYPIIELNKFTITDSVNHNLVLDGTITSRSISDYVLNMDINSKDFIMVNTPRSANEFIYGFAGVNSDLNIKGYFKSPVIQGTLSLNDATDATIILPQQSENRDKAKTVVRFIDRDTFALPEAILFTPQDSNENKVKTALKYNVNVGLSKKASLTIIIDPSTGDELKVSGDAKLNVGVDAGGNILFAGNYDLVKGHYILHYQFLKRQFDLLPQSTILFSGNPLDAQLDIRAEYIAKTSAIDLVGNELGDTDSKTANTFKQKIPFKVLLFIKGTIKKLDISFDIRMPDENSGLSNTIVTTVENKLTQLRADPSAINKQVFSLLVLNRFVGEQSSDFFKGNGGGLEDIARESVSKFLSAALDQIASDLVKGVDIDLNLNSYKDYSSGAEQQRTDLNVGVTKRFMNDRLSISLGKDFGVEGDDKNGKTRGSTNASYLPNAIVNYKLSKDGKYAVRAYSKNKFEVILDGYVVESGLSFLVTMDYEKFRELFEKKVKIN